MAFSESESTDRLVCDDDLDRPIVAAAADDPDFGSFEGQSIWVAPTNASIPAFAAGLSDLSIEMVILPREGSPAGASDFASLSGLCDGPDFSGDVVIGVTNIVSNLNSVVFTWTVGGPIRQLSINPFRPRTFWTYLCCNFDRSGDMEMFDNGSSVGTADISADVAVDVPSHGIYPMVGQSSILGITDDLTDDPDGLVLPWYSPFAGFAIHSRLLTPGEIATNNAALNTGDYAETEVRYNFRTFIDENGDRIDPSRDTNLDHISVFNKWTVNDSPYEGELFSPEGANDTLHIEDLSGNGRHFGLQTLAAYDDTNITNRGKVSFTITGRDFRS